MTPSPTFTTVPGRLVPQHHRVHAGRVADRALGVRVDVGPADANPAHTHLHFPGSRRLDGLFGQAEFPLSNEFGDKHKLAIVR